MRRFLTILYIALIVPTVAAVAQQPSADTLFPYPVAPDSMKTLQDRCSYVVEHFWDKCNMRQAFSHRVKLNDAFGHYVELLPYASAEVAHRSVDRLLEGNSRNPEYLLGLAQMAEGYLYSDTARMSIDEIYVKFINAVNNCKKIKNADKARYQAQGLILNNCQVGMTAPDIELTMADGTSTHLDSITDAHIILFFNDPDCGDCALARTRLSADWNISQFIKRGQLKIVSVFPGEPDDETWTSYRSRIPAEWISGAAPDADRLYDLRQPPVIYYLDRQHKILSKTMTAQQLIDAFAAINTGN